MMQTTMHVQSIKFWKKLRENVHICISYEFATAENLSYDSFTADLWDVIFIRAAMMKYQQWVIVS